MGTSGLGKDKAFWACDVKMAEPLSVEAPIRGGTLKVLECAALKTMQPTDNAFIEAFNGRFRAECLNAHWFLSLADAREEWKDLPKYDNEERSHGAIGQKMPTMLLNHVGAASPPP